MCSLPIEYEPSSISLDHEHGLIAVGGADSKIHIYELNNKSLAPKTEIDHLGPVTDCAFSPNNEFLVAADANRKVILYTVPAFTVSVYSTSHSGEL